MFHQGIVEEINDPLKLGRVRVRVLGKHTENKSTIDNNEYYPVADLPWAEPAFPIQSANVSGIADFMIPQQGSIVWCFFKDPEEQFPVYFAVSSRLGNQPDFTKGFSDPAQINPDSAFDGKSQIPDRAQGTNNLSKSPESGANVTEPDDSYAGTYPNNRVIETKSGHIIELDDTSGAERIHIYHKNGSFLEMYTNGDMVIKSQKDLYEIIVGNGEWLVKGNLNLDVEGNGEWLVKGNLNLNVEGTVNIEVTGKATIKADKIDIDGGNGITANSGCVTGESLCPILMIPHLKKSDEVKASGGSLG